MKGREMLAKQISNIANSNNIRSLGINKWSNPAEFNGIKLKYCNSKDSIYFTELSHLSESFIKSLTEIKGENPLNTVIKIKDAILKKMGYQSRSALKIEMEPQSFERAKKEGAGGGFNPEKANIAFIQDVLNYPIENQIAWLYHELDHLDKFVKLYKSVGKRNFDNFIHYLKAQVVKAHYGENNYKIDTYTNFDIYRKLAKGIDISNFDEKKWTEAILEYPPGSKNYSQLYSYYNNPLEQSAYDIEGIVLQTLGLNTKTPKDTFPNNYKNIQIALEKQGIKDLKTQDEIFKIVHGFTLVGKLDIKLLKICQKLKNGLDVSTKEKKILRQRKPKTT